MRKLKLSVEKQIAHMKNHNGIKFNIIDEDKAKEFLKDNSYYFKLKSYAKNYTKYPKGENAGKYIDLEFAYLVELSKIDMYLRRFIIRMTLDIEHFLKTQLLRDFQSNSKEDGYDIVNDLFKKHEFIKENISNKEYNSACSDLVQKYKDDFAIWNLVEVLSFGDFAKLYTLYYKKYQTKGSMECFLWSVKFIRNAAAHNSCLLNSLRIPYTKRFTPNKKILHFLSGIEGISRKDRQNKMNNPVVHDFVVTLYAFNNVVTSNKVKQNMMMELKDFIANRVATNKSYFEKNQFMVSYFIFFKNIIDYFYGLCL